MVSFWPWRGSDNSPASFEKTLSTLSTRIAQTTARLESHRQRSRRFKALWTLYTTFAYILYTLILTLVLGWQRWGPIEYSTISGGPVVIYLVRFIAQTFYKYRISKSQATLDELQKQRDETIEKLKEATKYNSTLQLLEKYGAEAPKPAKRNNSRGAKGDSGNGGVKRRTPRSRASLPAQDGMTGLAPPPTANIQPKQFGSLPSTSPLRPQSSPGPAPITPDFGSISTTTPTQYQADNEPGFHPSAFPSTPQYNEPRQPQWYDRLLDVLLGEDETLPKNRLALICSRCHLVNGQAPPGICSPEQLGRWRCGGCGELNGQDAVEPTGQKDSSNSAPGAQRPVLHHRSRSQSLPQPRPPVIIETTSAAEDDTSNEGSVDGDVEMNEGISADEDMDANSTELYSSTSSDRAFKSDNKAGAEESDEGEE